MITCCACGSYLSLLSVHYCCTNLHLLDYYYRVYLGGSYTTTLSEIYCSVLFAHFWRPACVFQLLITATVYYVSLLLFSSSLLTINDLLPLRRMKTNHDLN